MNAVALMYHDVVAPGCDDASGFPGGEAARYKITLERFSDHLRAIRRRTRNHPTTIESFLKTRRSAAPEETPLLLTFDDGGAGAQASADCLEVFGWRGHFFITTDYLDRPGFLTRAAVRELRRRGHVIGSHSCTHPLRMARLPPSRLHEEWHRSVDALANVLGEAVDVASVPGGDHSPAVAQAAGAAGIRVLFTSRPTIRMRQHDGMIILGRFVIRKSTSAAVTAAVAGGARAPRLAQLVAWDLRRATKAVAGAAYQNFRARQLGRSPDVRWGDDPAKS